VSRDTILQSFGLVTFTLNSRKMGMFQPYFLYETISAPTIPYILKAIQNAQKFQSEIAK